MLRFDLPQVYSNVIRVDAFVVTIISTIALLSEQPLFMLLLVFMGLIKGFIGHMKCPSHLVIRYILLKFNIAGRLEDAGAKMFASKVLFIASGASLILFFSGSSCWVIPISVLILFSTLEWLISFCAACWVYGEWYKRFPPK